MAPDSKLPIKLDGANDIEFYVREVGDDIYVLACKREGKTVKVETNFQAQCAHTKHAHLVFCGTYLILGQSS